MLRLPASLQPYLAPATDRLAGATDYLQSTTGLSPTALYTTACCVLLLGAIPVVASRGNSKLGNMRRYGFSNRYAVSPFSSQDGIPNVTDRDYSYITSADLEDHRPHSPRTYPPPPSYINDPYSRPPPSPTAHGRRRPPEDDVILIQYEGKTFAEQFPAYSIGDARLLVSDVRERVALIMNIPERQIKQIKLFYKGRRLKKADLPLCEYGVKDNSELLMIVGESSQGSATGSSEGNVDLRAADGRAGREPYELRGDSPRNSPKNSPRFGRSGRWGERSPRDSSSQVGFDTSADGKKRRAASRVRTQSPDGDVDRVAAAERRGTSRVRTQSPVGYSFDAPVRGNAPEVPVGKPGGPIEKINVIANDFKSTWVARCNEFVSRPPLDPKKRVDEHRRLSETILQQTLLKLDAIDTSTEPGARAIRKELIQEVNEILNRIDVIAKRPS